MIKGEFGGEERKRGGCQVFVLGDPNARIGNEEVLGVIWDRKYEIHILGRTVQISLDGKRLIMEGW